MHYGIIHDRIIPLTERYNMIKDKHFKITYYSNKDGKHITRTGTHDDKSRFWTSKIGEALYTYFDLDQWGYRTAKKSWTVRY